MNPARKKSLVKLLSNVTYDEASPSCLRWRSNMVDKKSRGCVAGWLHPSGYWHVRFGGHQFRAHRIVWLIHNGNLRDEVQIDHINNISYDNRICNLQTSTALANVRKRKRVSTNTSGFIGVSYVKRDKLWVINIKVNRRRLYLGSCKDPEMGAAVYDRAYILRFLYESVDVDLCWSREKIKVTSKQRNRLELNVHGSVLNNILNTYI